MYFSVGDLANFYGVSKDTIRLYDKKGIIPAKRMDNGYRLYSRADVISYAFVMLLRKMNLSLEEIHDILDNKNIKDINKILDNYITIKINEVENLKKSITVATEYKTILKDIEEKLNIYRIEITPPIIYKEIVNDEIMSTYKDFSNFYDHSLTIFSFIIKKELFNDDKTYDFNIEKENFKIAMTLKHDEPYLVDINESKKKYKIIPSRLCIVSIVDTEAGKDYKSLNNLKIFLKKFNIIANDDIMLRHLFSRGYPDKAKDYYEIIIPIEQLK